MVMTLPESKKPQPNAQVQSEQAAGEQQQTQQPKFNMNNPGQNLFDLRRNHGFSRSSASEDMRKILQQLDKIAGSEPTDSLVNYKFIPLDAEQHGLNISSLVVVCSLKNPVNENKHAVFHTLLLASTNRAARTREKKVEGTNVTYEHLVPVTDAMDDTMISIIVSTLNSTYPGYKLHSADCTVIPTTLNLDSEEAVRNLAANATTATYTLLATEIGGAAHVISRDFKGRSTGLSIKNSDHHFIDLAGQPVRSDVVLEVNELARNEENRGEYRFHGDAASDNLLQINGYFDLTYDPVLSSVAAGYGQAHQASNPNELKTYKPRFVVTNVDSLSACDLTLQLLGLATTQVLPLGDHHIASLIEQHRAGERAMEGNINLRDIGAIGLEVPTAMNMMMPGVEPPKPARFPTAGANVSDETLATIIRTYVSGPDTQISMDVPEGGPSTWMTAVFAAAAEGDPVAIKEIFAAADVLTGNRFSEIYTTACGGRMLDPVFNDNLTVNLGSYMSKNQLRDIRDLDYLAVLNMSGDMSLETINNWSNLQANSSVDVDFRAMEARKVLQAAFKSLQFTGIAKRVTFRNLFLQALLSAIREAGLTYQVTSSKQAPVGTGRLVNSYLSQQTRFGEHSNAFTSGRQQRTQGNDAATSSFGRFAYSNSLNRNSGY